MVKIFVPEEIVLSPAEIADKITIWELKSQHGLPGRAEAARLLRYCKLPDEILGQLRQANKACWDAVDAMTAHYDGHKVLPDAEIVEVCRQGYLKNRERVRIKNQITERFGGTPEVKSWSK